MGWRTLVVSEDSNLKLLNGNLHIFHKDGKVSLPIDDLDFILLESPKGSLSVPVLKELAKRGTALLVVDEKYLPCGLFLPYSVNEKHAGLLYDQLRLKLPFKKRVWQKIIKRKILNSAAALELLGRDGAEVLRQMAELVKSGDSTNQEAKAARFYFKRLDSEFARSRSDLASIALDYGYAIVRSALARSFASAGLHCALGVAHRSRLNPFNLVDDFIEVFRPFVDVLVFSSPPEDELDANYKKYLIKVLKMECIIGTKVYSVATAAHEIAYSYARAVQTQNHSLIKLPHLQELSFRTYE